MCQILVALFILPFIPQVILLHKVRRYLLHLREKAVSLIISRYNDRVLSLEYINGNVAPVKIAEVSPES